MFGKTVDYWLLRPLAHSRNRATEAELDARSRENPVDYDGAVPKLAKLMARFGGRFPVDPRLSYLDMGCGAGEYALALACLGALDVTGVDFVPRRIEEARAGAQRLGFAHRVHFECADLRIWEPDRRFDAIVSNNAFEHIDAPEAFLATMSRFVAPDGRAILSFGPLFHSPFGDHCWDYFHVQIPWRGVLFSEEALIRLRREFFRPTDPATRLREIRGGLNQLRLSSFRCSVLATGWRFDFLSINHGAAKIPGAKRLSDLVCASPLGDYFAHSVDAVLRRGEGLRADLL